MYTFAMFSISINVRFCIMHVLCDMLLWFLHYMWHALLDWKIIGCTIAIIFIIQLNIWECTHNMFRINYKINEYVLHYYTCDIWLCVTHMCCTLYEWMKMWCSYVYCCNYIIVMYYTCSIYRQGVRACNIPLLSRYMIALKCITHMQCIWPGCSRVQYTVTIIIIWSCITHVIHRYCFNYVIIWTYITLVQYITIMCDVLLFDVNMNYTRYIAFFSYIMFYDL